MKNSFLIIENQEKKMVKNVGNFKSVRSYFMADPCPKSVQYSMTSFEPYLSQNFQYWGKMTLVAATLVMDTVCTFAAFSQNFFFLKN